MHIPRDKLNRPLHDVRISVIDRCNFRCTYCMPQKENKDYDFLPKTEWLNKKEIIKLAKAFVALGVQKIRITGGEPLLRPDVPEIIESLVKLEGTPEIALTTNGSLLTQHAKQLKNAGLSRLTVSLDTLDSRLFQQMGGTHTPISKIMDGIAEAEASGFNTIKFNVVVQKGVNDHQIIPMVKHFRGTKHILRFIEYMDVGNCNHWNRQFVVPSKEIRDLISENYPLEPVNENYYGEVAKRYRFVDGKGEIGFISSVTQPFCESCTRMRVTTDGQLVTCLFATKGVNIREALRGTDSGSTITDLISQVWEARIDQYSNLRASNDTTTHPHKKIEMYQIGG